MNYNIINIILIVIIVGLLAKMSQTQEHFEIMSRIERGKKVCKSDKFTPWTLTFPDEDEVKRILNTVLQYINQKMDMNYHLGKIDNVTKEFDYQQNTRYLIDFFSYHLDPEKRNDINRRFILDVTKKPDNVLRVNLLTIGNAKKYGHPNELLLPEMEDNELIIKDTNLSSNHHIIGKVNQTMDYGLNESVVDVRHIPDIEHHYQSWILPEGAEQKKEIYPCRKQHKWWDINGVHYTDNQNGLCQGLDTSATPRPVQPEFQAGHGKILADKNQYTWLFDKARGRQSSTEPLVGPTPVM